MSKNRFLLQRTILCFTRRRRVAQLLLFSLLTLISAGWLINQKAVESKILSRAEKEDILAKASQISLKEIIAAQYPEIENPGISDWRKVSILRRWAYENIKVSTKSCLLETVFYPDFYNKDVTEMYLAFKNNIGGVWCGGASVFLAKLYRHYGFEAYTANTGKIDVWTHVVTLVKIRHQDNPLLSIQDALTNVTYTQPDGSPLDFSELIKLLQKRQSNQIKLIQADNAEQQVLVCPGEAQREFDIRRTLFPCDGLPDGGMVCRYRPLLEDYTDRSPRASAIKASLKRDGYEPDFIYMFMYTFSIHDGVRERTDLLSRFQKLAQR